MNKILSYISMKHVISFTIALGIINAGWIYVYRPYVEGAAVAPVAMQLAEAQKRALEAESKLSDANKSLEAARTCMGILMEAAQAKGVKISEEQ